MSYIPASRMPHAAPHAAPAPEPAPLTPRRTSESGRWLAFGGLAAGVIAGLLWAKRR